MEAVFFHLSSCSTCARISKTLDLGENVRVQDIKNQPVNAQQLKAMAALAGSYESLFSKRARQYRALGLHEKKLTEKDYRELILEEYTFLKRPVLWLPKRVVARNSKKAVQEMEEALKNLS